MLSFRRIAGWVERSETHQQLRHAMGFAKAQPIHELLVSHHKEREKLAEHTAFSGLKAELQIRTVLQHAWAVLDRKLRYNNEEDIPRQVRRKLFRISALLEIADENFSEIDKIVSDLREQYASDIKGGNLEQEINLDSLEVFMREAASVKALEREAKKHYEISLVNEQSYSDPDVLKSVSNLVMSAHLAGIKTIKNLNDVVVEFNKIAKETFLHLVNLTTNDTFTTAGLIRLTLVYVIDKQLSVRILRLVPFNGKLQASLCEILHPDEKFNDDQKDSFLKWLTVQNVSDSAFRNLKWIPSTAVVVPKPHRTTKKKRRKS
jgi:hypothetical protein